MAPLSFVVFITTLTVFISAQDDSKWWLHSGIQCCGCVPYFACSFNNVVDKKILSNLNENNFKITHNNECENPSEVCCQLEEELDSKCKNFTVPIIIQINRLARDISCKCVPWELCTAKGIVTDGKGQISETLQGYNIPPHSKCTGKIEVCCDEKELEVMQVTNRMAGNSDKDCECVEQSLCGDTDGINVIEPRTRESQDDSADEEDREIHLRNENSNGPKCTEKDQVCCPKDQVLKEKTGDANFVKSSLLLVFASAFIWII